MPNFSRGAAQAEAAAKAASSGRADFLSIKQGERVILRPVSDLDDIIPIDIHMGVPTKKAPKGIKEDKWPSQMSAVCRNGDAFKVRNPDGTLADEYESDDQGHPYGDCYIHEHMGEVMGKYKQPVSKTKSQTWGLFAVREEVRDSGSKKLVGFRDVTEDWKDEAGKVHKIPKIVIASQSWSNFWAPFNSAGAMTDTICDRDFAVERVENDYIISAGRETPDHHPGTDSWQRYLDAMELKGVSIEAVLLDQSSWKYYGRFFDPNYKDEEEDGDDAGAGEAAEATVSDEEAAALRAKMASSFAETQPT
jgi:hypothetical protein